jgi:hypothetical protein
LEAIQVRHARCWRYDWVLDLDIKGFLDPVSYCPWRTGRDLLAGDDAVVDETMNGRRCDAERGRRTFDGQQLTCSDVSIRDEARNPPVRPQAANTTGLCAAS